MRELPTQRIRHRHSLTEKTLFHSFVTNKPVPQVHNIPVFKIRQWITLEQEIIGYSRGCKRTENQDATYFLYHYFLSNLNTNLEESSKPKVNLSVTSETPSVTGISGALTIPNKKISPHRRKWLCGMVY